MDLMQCIKTFVLVVETGSFARAAKRMNLSNASTTRHVAHLEAVLGGRLLNRTTRKLRVTEAGQGCFERFQRMLDDLDGAAQTVQAGTVQPQGLLRVSSTIQFWTNRVAPALPEFQRRYPKLSLHVSLTERIPDIVDEGYDVSLQIEPPHTQTLIAKPIVPLRRIVYASPDYVRRHGSPRLPEDLSQHNCLLYAHYAERIDWQFTHDGVDHRVRVEGSLRSNDVNTLRICALAGLGVARGPVFLLTEDLNAGRLVQLLPDYESVDPHLWLIYSSRKLLSAKVRVFIDFLEERFATDPAFRIPPGGWLAS